MAILRAGPFGYQVFDESIPNEYFQNQPTSPISRGDGGPTILPINCADFTGSTKWSWSYYSVTDVDPFNAIYSVAPLNASSITNSFSSSDMAFETEGLYFAYQAAQNFTITGSYSCDSGEGQGAFSSFVVKYSDPSSGDGFVQLFEDIKEDDGQGGGTAISGSFSGQLPATVQPRSVHLSFFCDGNSSTGSITINLTPGT
jgi:hypothetical protein